MKWRLKNVDDFYGKINIFSSKQHFYIFKEFKKLSTKERDRSHTVWKNKKLSLTLKIFRQINSLVTYLVKPLLSRNFAKKVCERELRT